MNKLIQSLVLLIAFAFAANPVMAKEETKSSKAKSSQTQKTKEKKAKAKKEDKKKSTDSKTTKSKTKESTKAKSTKQDKKSDSQSSTTVKKDKDSSSSKSSSKSTSSSSKNPAKSKMTGTDKAKQYKNVTVNINKADAATLSTYLVGIGATRAKDIVNYRKKNGNFKSTDELLKVTGIGDAIFAGLKKNVSTSKGETTPPKKK